MPSWESHFAALFCDYLTAADESETGIPADLVKRTLDEGLTTGSHPRPRLVVSCEMAEPPHRRMLALVLRVDLLTRLGEGEDATTPFSATGWMRAVRDHLADDEAWKSFILSLEESRRTGWRILRRWLAGTEIADDREQLTRDYRQPVHLRVSI